MKVCFVLFQRWFKPNLVINFRKCFPNAFRFFETYFQMINIKTHTGSDLETLNQWVEGSSPSGVTKGKRHFTDKSGKAF